MQDNNDPIAERPPEEKGEADSQNAPPIARTSRLRSRYGQKSGGTSSTDSTETIGEIQLVPGEIPKDDLTANSDAARAKGGNRRSEAQDDRSRQKRREGYESGRTQRGHRERRGRHGRDSGNRDRGDQHGKRESRGKQSAERPDREERDERNRGKHGNPEKGKSSGRRDRSRGREGRRSKSSEENKPVTWNAGTKQKSPGLIGKAGKFLSSIFGGSKQEEPADSKEKSRHKERRSGDGKRRRRKRSQGGNRGSHSRS